MSLVVTSRNQGAFRELVANKPDNLLPVLHWSGTRRRGISVPISSFNLKPPLKLVAYSIPDAIHDLQTYYDESSYFYPLAQEQGVIQMGQTYALRDSRAPCTSCSLRVYFVFTSCVLRVYFVFGGKRNPLGSIAIEDGGNVRIVGPAGRFLWLARKRKSKKKR